MKRALLVMPVLFMASCAQLERPDGLVPEISAEMARTGERKVPSRGEALERALLPPQQIGMPSVPGLELEQRFDLAVANAPAAQVFMSIVVGHALQHAGASRRHAARSRSISRTSPCEDALSAIRDLYGYDYRIEGTRVFVQGAGLQTRVFQVNYLPGQRRGSSEVRVQSSAISESRRASAPGTVPRHGHAAPRARSSRAG